MPSFNQAARNICRIDLSALESPRPPTGEGSDRLPAGKPPEGFVRRKTGVIPVWAKAVRLVANRIDGWPPVSDGVYLVEDFIRVAETVQRKHGAGEWDVLVYAVEDPNGGADVHPYGQDNPYRRLRSARGHRIKQIARFSYMRWDWYDFTVLG